jgi:hypothetical protein
MDRPASRPMSIDNRFGGPRYRSDSHPVDKHEENDDLTLSPGLRIGHAGRAEDRPEGESAAIRPWYLDHHDKVLARARAVPLGPGLLNEEETVFEHPIRPTLNVHGRTTGLDACHSQYTRRWIMGHC